MRTTFYAVAALATLMLVQTAPEAAAESASLPFKVTSATPEQVVLCDEESCMQVNPLPASTERTDRCSETNLLRSTYMMDYDANPYDPANVKDVADLAAVLEGKESVNVMWATCHTEGEIGMVPASLCAITRGGEIEADDDNFDICVRALMKYDTFYNNQYDDYPQ